MSWLHVTLSVTLSVTLHVTLSVTVNVTLRIFYVTLHTVYAQSIRFVIIFEFLQYFSGLIDFQNFWLISFINRSSGHDLKKRSQVIQNKNFSRR